MGRKLVIDFESFFCRKEKFDLKSISTVEYVRSTKFKVHGFGYQWLDEGRPIWVPGNKAANLLMVLPWNEIDLIAHNAKFDGFILKEHYGYAPASFICTKAMSKSVLGKRIKNHSLATLAKHFGLEDKGQMKTDGLKDLTPEQEAELATYCLHDVELCAEIYKRLEPEFPKSQYAPMNWTIKTFVMPKLELDVKLLEQTVKNEEKRKKTIFSDLQIAKSEFSSNPKFMKLLQNEGFEVPMKTSPRTGKEIPALALGDVDFLEMLESENERLKTLCEARVAAKSILIETRSAKLLRIGKTGTWPFDVEFSGAEQTHRYSGGGAAGGNPQNFTACRDKDAHKKGHDCPGILRQAVIAPKGYKLVVADFSAADARFVAYLAKDEKLMWMFDRGESPYLDFGSNFYGRQIDKHKDPFEYVFSKEGVLSSGYGQGAESLQRRIKIRTNKSVDLDTAKKAVDFYRQRYTSVPVIWELLHNTIPLLTQSGKGQLLNLPINYKKEEIILPSGLSIQFPNLRQEKIGYKDKRTGETKNRLEWVFDTYSKSKLKKAKLYGGKLFALICQACTGELCKEAIQAVEQWVYGQVHDELILVVREEMAEQVAKMLEQVMSTSPKWLPEMKLKAEVGIAKNWLEAK